MPHIFLYGPSGSGKSTIGTSLARNLQLPFLDSDQVTESIAGMSIPEVVEAHGMSRMRDLETEALKQIVNGEESVVALGGGALLRDENRLLVETHGRVVMLTAELPTLIDRLKSDPNERPLLAGDLETRLTAYLDSRVEHYSSFPLTVHVDGKSPAEISREIQTMLGRHHLSAMGGYDVIIGPITNLPYGDFIVTDENVAIHHLDKVKQILPQVRSIVIPAGEEHKNLETVSLLWKAFLENGLDRKSTVIVLGGGVVSDMTGFAAATYMRGINWVGVPTTLLSMADASLGGKTGFDLPEGKNLIGSFHAPKLVMADPSLLLTLPERELRSGMAEVVKHGIISDPALFAMCNRGLDWVKANLEEVVRHAVAVKIQVIEEDPYEKGLRATLNLGHTVGHAVELTSRFELRHGEAIAIGMVAEARYAARVGLAGQNTVEAIVDSLSALGLPIQIPEGMPREEIIRSMRMDKKKNAKSIRFALPVEIGRVKLVEVENLEEVI